MSVYDSRVLKIETSSVNTEITTINTEITTKSVNSRSLYIFIQAQSAVVTVQQIRAHAVAAVGFKLTKIIQKILHGSVRKNIGDRYAGKQSGPSDSN
jgi:hypothetical protein